LEKHELNKKQYPPDIRGEELKGSRAFTRRNPNPAPDVFIGRAAKSRGH
jgi:hypothetical protein